MAERRIHTRPAPSRGLQEAHRDLRPGTLRELPLDPDPVPRLRPQRRHDRSPVPRGLLQGGICFEPSRLDEWSPPLPPARAPSHTQDIRAWGRANGYDVPMRGRIPAGVRQAWEQAHPNN
ncbi:MULTISPECIES: Lsr2 dimerization domain-containing protein [Streptomyces]|uniref:Histone-like nucleoid-structuring protein Lsr2 n=1 Tax=Streptomyces flaveolus TaxID=67297 RepID=A0ABV3AJX0_9ACTN|nr:MULTISPECIES: histone-like nucleoid-structuring protein Lsr2 [Streptomyces]